MKNSMVYARRLGRACYRIGLTRFDCPYPHRSALGSSWLDGYNAESHDRWSNP